MSGIKPMATESRQTILLTRADVAGLMDPAAYLDAVEAGFRAGATGRAQAPTPLSLPVPGGGFHGKAASIMLDRDYVALKFNANFPGNPRDHGLPTIQGAILLCDGGTGALLAIMDSIEVTLGRTAAATALAARHLARADSRSILLCGCGEQAPAQLAALRAVLPLDRAMVWDGDVDRAHAFARTHTRDDFTVLTADDLARAARASDVIVTCTSARAPFLDELMIEPGTFIAAVGADNPDKNEIAPSLMARSTVVADVIEQCAAMGDLRHAIAAGAMTLDDVYCDLGALTTGRIPAPPAGGITLFDSTGTGLQDVATAVVIYSRACAAGRGTTINLATAG
jgi:ornithine cyclodeaminase/alanine dehydrogenase-like protein (mu-crystallin family)